MSEPVPRQQGATTSKMLHKAKRLAFLSVAVLFFVITFPPVFSILYLHIISLFPAAKTEAYSWGEPAQLAYSSKIDVSGALFQTSLVLIGAMWGLIISKKTEVSVVLHDWPEFWLVIVGTLVLLSSCYGYIAYVDAIEGYLLDASISGKLPPASDSYVAVGLNLQYVTLVGGLLAFGVAIYSAMHYRK